MDSSAKVLQCYRTFFPESQGGVEQVIFELARNTDGEVLTLSRTPMYGGVFLGVKYEAMRRWFSIASCCVGLGLLPRLFQKTPDILHFHFPWPFGDVSYLLAGRSRPLVVTYHSDIIRQRFLGAIYRPLMNYFLRRADRIVATSRAYANTSKVLSAYSDKVEVIPLGISESNYPCPDSQTIESVESRFGRDFMLFVGVLRYYKGLDYLVRAAVGQPYRVVIAGRGPEMDRLMALAKRLGAKNVVFAGFVSEAEKMALFSLCRAVVFPSHLRSEAFGVTLLEGLMSGRPLISCEIGTGTSYVNSHGETGYVVKAADVDELKNAMCKLWCEPGVAFSMGLAGKRRFKRLFTAERMATSYQRLYEEVLEERGVASGG
ncbi:glycosyltransferase [Microbulbifer sp. SSSA008]|uniref:glycosyltransferase n=1 Tax=Microbulbifer sp. SSSA008 TaxID=3243380 RepID=UPI00403A3ACE